MNSREKQYDDIKSREIYSELKCLAPCFVRLDGRAFHTFTKDLEKPFDDEFVRTMVFITQDLMNESELRPTFGYVFSDEISLFFEKLPFNGRVEKLTSVAASFAASSFTGLWEGGSLVSFDARVVPVDTRSAYRYMLWRQDEAYRNCINMYVYAELDKLGLSHKEFDKLGSHDRVEWLKNQGITLEDIPEKHKRGTLVYRSKTKKIGYNPVTKTQVEVERNTLLTNSEVPNFRYDVGIALLMELGISPH